MDALSSVVPFHLGLKTYDSFRSGLLAEDLECMRLTESGSQLRQATVSVSTAATARSDK